MSMIVQNILLGALSAIGSGVLAYAWKSLSKVLTLVKDFAEHRNTVIRQGQNLARLERQIEHVHQDMLSLMELFRQHVSR